MESPRVPVRASAASQERQSTHRNPVAHPGAGREGFLMPDAITIQSLTSADRDALLALDQAAFGFDGRDLDPEGDTQWIEWDRAYGARREGVLGGIYVVFSFGIGVPASPP